VADKEFTFNMTYPCWKNEMLEIRQDDVITGSPINKIGLNEFEEYVYLTDAKGT